MSSNINPNNINGAYPIAGQDNDSQGFRDNFTNIRTNLTFAKEEINDLQTRALFKTPAAGETNSVQSITTILAGAKTRGFTKSGTDLGTPASPIEIAFSNGDLQKFTTVGVTELSLTGWVSSTYTTIKVWINVANVAHTITFPTSVTVGLNKLGSVAGQVLTPVVGDYLLEFGSIDGGTTVFVIPLITP